jgi:hypothetical protein
MDTHKPTKDPLGQAEAHSGEDFHGVADAPLGAFSAVQCSAVQCSAVQCTNRCAMTQFVFGRCAQFQWALAAGYLHRPLQDHWLLYSTLLTAPGTAFKAGSRSNTN